MRWLQKGKDDSGCLEQILLDVLEAAVNCCFSGALNLSRSCPCGF